MFRGSPKPLTRRKRQAAVCPERPPELEFLLPCHSPLMPFALISAAHFSVSFLRTAASSAGVEGAGSAPIAESFALRSGFVRAARTALFRLSTTSGETFDDTKSAYQLLVSTPL